MRRDSDRDKKGSERLFNGKHRKRWRQISPELTPFRCNSSSCCCKARQCTSENDRNRGKTGRGTKNEERLEYETLISGPVSIGICWRKPGDLSEVMLLTPGLNLSACQILVTIKLKPSLLHYSMGHSLAQTPVRETRHKWTESTREQILNQAPLQKGQCSGISQLGVKGSNVWVVSSESQAISLLDKAVTITDRAGKQTIPLD